MWASQRGFAAASTVLLGAALAAVAFGAAGGTELTRTTIAEVLAVLAAGGVAAIAVVLGRRGPVWGATALVLFAALAVYTALAVLWSIRPELTYQEASRTLTYLAVFGAALAAARAAPRAAPVVAGGVLLAAMAAVAYALASRVWPGTLAEDELSNRIGQPFQYWNAVGTVAAMAIPVTLWLGSRRPGPALLRAAAYPAAGLAVVAIMLTQSRGALLAAVVAVVLWLAVVPLRLRSLPVIVAPAIGGGLVSAWALSKAPFSRPLQPLAAKESVAGEFGLLLLLLVAGLLLVGLVVSVGLGRGLPPVRARRRIGLAVAIVACALPLVGLTSVAFSDRGLGGTIGDRVDELTSETETAPEEGAGRIGSASNTRGKYWREARKVFDDRPAVGTGPGTFRTARLRHRTDAAVTGHAHGYVAQTAADMGLLGLALSGALLIAWLVGAARATALHPRRRRRAERRDWDGDRVALVTLVLVAVAFGVQSVIDWTWFVPGAAAMALVPAGFVAGRGPAWALPSEQPARRGPRMAAAAAILVTAALAAWAIWQPEASDRQSNRAAELSDQGRHGEAIAEANRAADTDPLTPKPYFVRAAAETAAGRTDAARRSLERAVLRYPGDPQTWLKLAGFQLGTLATLRGLLYLDPHSAAGRTLFLDARIRGRQQERAERDGGATASPPPAASPGAGGATAPQTPAPPAAPPASAD